MDDLFVVGLDLISGLEVHIGDRSVPEWHAKGHNGDRTLVCLHCYRSQGPDGGPHLVALVPKGRVGGKRRWHFAHPPGMAPADGQHTPESAWHADAKQALARWARTQGARARVEANTPDQRRRSDVEVGLPGGARIALEMQYRSISDTEWLARHQDYASTGTIDVWLWHKDVEVPRILYAHRQPGWILGPEVSQIGLAHTAPPGTGERSSGGQCGKVHWPPCVLDPVAMHWMPLGEAALSSSGIVPAPQVERAIANLAADAGKPPLDRMSAVDYMATYAAQRRLADLERRAAGRAIAAESAHSSHRAYRYDAQPPWTDPMTWRYRCNECDTSFSGAELQASRITHYIEGHDPTAGTTAST